MDIQEAVAKLRSPVHAKVADLDPPKELAVREVDVDTDNINRKT